MTLKDKEEYLLGCFPGCRSLLNLYIDESVAKKFPKVADKIIKLSNLSVDNGEDSNEYVLYVNLLYNLYKK